jgi:hypothetical protein
MSANPADQRADRPQGAGPRLQHAWPHAGDQLLHPRRKPLPGRPARLWLRRGAQVPIVEKWQALLKAYLAGRATLRRAFVLIDARHGIKPVDEEIMSLLDTAAVTFQVVLTKADKVRSKDQNRVLDQIRTRLATHPAAFPELVLTSSETGDGIPTLRSIVAELA